MNILIEILKKDVKEKVINQPTTQANPSLVNRFSLNATPTREELILYANESLIFFDWQLDEYIVFPAELSSSLEKRSNVACDFDSNPLSLSLLLSFSISLFNTI